MTRRFPLLLLLLAALVVPFPAFAQLTTGTLVGDVTTGGSPLPGVTITVSSPSLQGTRSTVSGEGGGYILPALPPGDYTVTFDLSGMRKTEQKVKISVSQTARADADLKVAELSETVTITAAAPSVIESTTVATNFTSNQINELPINRTIDAVTDLAPGVTSAGPNNQITISGSTSFDNLFLVDGVVVNENLRGQPNALYIEDAIQETSVLTGGISAEFGRFTGGVVSTITKSGGNEFTGSIRDSLSNPNWSSKTDFAAQADPIDSINSSYEGTLGGRIVRDRLWFFTAGRYNKQDLSRQTALTNIPFVFSTFDRRFEGKFTGQVTHSQSLVASYIDSRERRTNNVSGGTVVDLRSLAPYSRPKNLISVNYNGVLSPQLLLEGQYSRMRDRFTNGAETRDLIEGTLLVDDDQGVRGWSPTFCGSPCPAKVRNNKGYLGKASYYLSTRSAGSHNFVGGYEEFHQIRNENNYQSGSDLRIHGTYIIVGDKTFFGIDPNVGQIEYDPVPALSQTSDFATRSVFFNDKWDLNRHVSFNLGGRYDKAFGKDQAGHTTVDDSAVSPRLAVNFDVRGDGRQRFSATYGKYVSKVDQGPADNTAGAGRYASYYWDYTGPVINPEGTPVDKLVATPEVIRQVFNWFNSVGGTRNTTLLNSAFVPGVTTRFDHSLKAPSMTEVSLGYAVALSSRGYLRADLIHRDWKDFYAITRTLATGTSEDAYGNTYDQGVIENSDEGLSRKYQALQLQGNFQLAPAFGLGGNYTYAKLRGNVEGETPSFATSITDVHNRPEYTGFANYNPVGNLGPDMRHRANVWLTYTLPTAVAGNFNFSLLERYHSALPYSAFAAIDVRRGTANGPTNGVANPGYEAPPSSVNYFFSERGAFRVDSISSTDLGVNWYLPFHGFGRVFVEADLVNIFNQQGIEDPDFINQTVFTRRSTSCKQASGVRCVAFNPFSETPVEGVNWQKGPIFGQPTDSRAYQTPRTYRLSLGYRF
jgi:hypothetical protein